MNIFGENCPRLGHPIFEDVFPAVVAGGNFFGVDFERHVVEVERRQRRAQVDGSGRLGPQRSELSANRFAALQVAVARLFDVVQKIGPFVLI